jgi:hypothetical protein
MRYALYAVVLATITGGASAAEAQVCTATEASADVSWGYHVSIDTTFYILGYAPAKIISNDGQHDFIARDEDGARGEVRGRLRLYGRYLHFELEPYTVLPNGDVLKVNLAGLEAYLFVPVHDRFRFGLYHHSSHNFSDADYGHGIDLDGVVLDAMVWKDTFTMEDEEGNVNLRILGSAYYNRKASPHIFTTDTATIASSINDTAWRAEAHLSVRHPMWNADCALLVSGAETWIPSSLHVSCAALLKMNLQLLGAFGDHFFVGPYVAYGQNFTRTDEFGSNAFLFGLRIALLYADTPRPASLFP